MQRTRKMNLLNTLRPLSKSVMCKNFSCSADSCHLQFTTCANYILNVTGHEILIGNWRLNCLILWAAISYNRCCHNVATQTNVGFQKLDILSNAIGFYRYKVLRLRKLKCSKINQTGVKETIYILWTLNIRINLIDVWYIFSNFDFFCICIFLWHISYLIASYYISNLNIRLNMLFEKKILILKHAKHMLLGIDLVYSLMGVF